jgi:hypothetical protein
MTLTTEAGLAEIKVIDAVTMLLDMNGVASTERIAAVSGVCVKDVFCFMTGLLRSGVVQFSAGLQVWIVARG